MGIIRNGVDLHPMVVFIGHDFSFLSSHGFGPWFSVYLTSEYYSDHGFPKSKAIAAIPPMASI